MEDSEIESSMQMRLLRRLSTVIGEFYVEETGRDPFFSSAMEEDGSSFQISLRVPDSSQLGIQVTVEVVNT